jgi:hypothetical protein
MAKKQKRRTFTRVATLFGSDQSATECIEACMRSTSVLMGEMQIVLAYLLGMLNLENERHASFLASVKDADLRALVRTYDSASQIDKWTFHDLAYGLCRLGSFSADHFRRLAADKGEVNGLMNSLGSLISSYTGHFDTDEKTGSLEWKEGELAKLEEERVLGGLSNPRYEEAWNELQILWLVREIYRDIGDGYMDSVAKSMGVFANILGGFAKWSRKIILKGVTQVMSGVINGQVTRGQEGFQLQLKESRLETDMSAKNKPAAEYRRYLEFRQSHADFIKDLEAAEKENPHTSWKLLADKLIREFFKPTKSGKFPDWTDLTHEELKNKPVVRVFSRNHSLYQKFRSGVSPVEFTPNDGEGHVFKLAYPGPKTAKGSLTYLITEIQRSTSGSGRGVISITLPNTEVVNTEFTFRADQGEFLQSLMVGKWGEGNWVATYGNRRIECKAALGGIKPVVHLNSSGRKTLRFDITVNFDEAPCEVRDTFDKKEKRHKFSPGTRVGVVSQATDGRLWFSAYEMTEKGPRLMRVASGTNPVSHEIVLKERKWAPLPKVFLYPDGGSRKASREEFGRLLSALQRADSQTSDEDLVSKLDSVLGGKGDFTLESLGLLRLHRERRDQKISSGGPPEDSLEVKKTSARLDVIFAAWQKWQKLKKRYKDFVAAHFEELHVLEKEENPTPGQKKRRRLIQRRTEAIDKKIKLIRRRLLHLKRDRVRTFAHQIATLCLEHGVQVLVVQESPNKTPARPSRFRPQPKANTIQLLSTRADLLTWIGYQMEYLGIWMIKDKYWYVEDVCPRCGRKGLLVYQDGESFSLADPTQDSELPASRVFVCPHSGTVDGRACSKGTPEPAHVATMMMQHVLGTVAHVVGEEKKDVVGAVRKRISLN